MQWCLTLNYARETSHYMGVSAWLKSNGKNLCRGNSKKGYILPRVKDPDWFRHSYDESPKNVGRSAKPAVGPQKFPTHKRHLVLQFK